jgi:hypothetical protein
VSDPESIRVVAQPVRPIPPRRWWLKRILLAAGVFVLALVGLRWWWGWEAERRLQAKIAEYRAAGQPVLLEDFSPSVVPDEENAALLLRQAASKQVPPGDRDVSLSDLATDRALCAERRDLAAQLVRDNAETLGLLRAARGKTAARWGTVIASPVINVMLFSLPPQRDLAKLLVVTAIHQHQTGDDAGAIESIRDMLAVARHVEDGEPILISHLVRVAIDALATNTVEAICTDLRVAPAEPPAQGRGVPRHWPGGFRSNANQSPTADQAASRDSVEALIAELLDERSLQASSKLSMYGERMMQLDAVVALTQGRFGLTSAPMASSAGLFNRCTALLLAPAWKLDGLRMIERTTRMAEATSAQNWPAAASMIPATLQPPSGPAAVVRLMSSILEPSLDRAVQTHFRLRTDRRLAATGLAVRLYELDHGRRPDVLTELVPDYLASIPTDPFHADNAEIRYLPDAPSPLLYSVGPDGVDDGGVFKLKADGGVDQEVLDRPFFLNGDRPRARRPPLLSPTESPATDSQPSSDQAVDDDRNVEEAERNQQQ